MIVLPDVLQINLSVVFAGTAAGDASAKARAYYAEPGNQFWPTLHAIGLTPRVLAPHEYPLLASFGIGLTDVVKTRSGPDDGLERADFDVEGFCARLRQYSPRVVAFNGKKAASIVFDEPTNEIQIGLQNRKLGDSQVFVLPSTSGSARGYWDVTRWHELSAQLRCEV